MCAGQKSEGYGDYTFHTETEKVFGSLFIICGVAFVGFCLAHLAAYVIEKSEAKERNLRWGVEEPKEGDA